MILHLTLPRPVVLEHGSMEILELN